MRATPRRRDGRRPRQPRRAPRPARCRWRDPLFSPGCGRCQARRRAGDGRARPPAVHDLPGAARPPRGGGRRWGPRSPPRPSAPSGSTRPVTGSPPPIKELFRLIPARNLVLVGAALADGPRRRHRARDRCSSTAAIPSLRPRRTAPPPATPKDTAARAVADAYRTSLGDAPLAGRLTGRSVVLVTLPGAPKPSVEAVGTAVRGAGGTVVGTVGFTDRLLDPADRQFAAASPPRPSRGSPTPTRKGWPTTRSSPRRSAVASRLRRRPRSTRRPRTCWRPSPRAS